MESVPLKETEGESADPASFLAQAFPATCEPPAPGRHSPALEPTGGGTHPGRRLPAPPALRPCPPPPPCLLSSEPAQSTPLRTGPPLEVLCSEALCPAHSLLNINISTLRASRHFDSTPTASKNVTVKPTCISGAGVWSAPFQLGRSVAPQDPGVCRGAAPLCKAGMGCHRVRVA